VVKNDISNAAKFIMQ
jgi:hypothetical protein